VSQIGVIKVLSSKVKFMLRLHVDGAPETQTTLEWSIVVLFVSAVGGAMVVVVDDLSVCGSKIVQQ
jgi:hypothetical protein